MAQGAVVSLSTNGVALAAEELREIAEYEKIVQFRDQILAGTHPRIKIPAHLVGKQTNSTRNTSSPSLPVPHANGTQLKRSISGTQNNSSSPSYSGRSPINNRATTSGQPAMASKSGINPILLEKSDDLIKAEMQLQRQRIERSLREQIEQQRLATKALLQSSESLPSFDITEVLAKALAIVQPSTDVEPSIDASASDSFDENTFYSSQHDTPEPPSPSQNQNESSVLSQVVAMDPKNSSAISYAKGQAADRDNGMATALLSHGQLTAQAHSQSQQGTHIMGNGGNSAFGAESGRRNSFTATVSTHSHKVVAALQSGMANNKSISPLVRAHDLSPLAPQPARFSPLVTAREPPVLRDQLAVGGITPPQVSALRQEPPGNSSANGSPKPAVGSEKKRGKREKRKDDKRRKASSSGNADTPDLPYIKPEPRSPSPYSVAPLPRPQKRQRQSGQYAPELNYDEPRYEPTEDVQAPMQKRYKEAPLTRTYERYEDRYGVEPRRPEPVYQRVERREDEYRRVDDGQYARRPNSPSIYTLPYAPEPARSVRAVSRMVERRVYEEPVYYREPVPRASVRPDGDRERSRSPIIHERRSPLPMAPPRRPLRIVVDEFGREYYEPSAPVVSTRQSMAPPARYRDADPVYERAALRAVSGRPVESHEDDGVVYRRASPVLTVPRRIAAPPEYAPEYRSYRQREYSVRPIGPPGEEYVQIREAPERRQMSHFEEPSRQYVQAPSVHPEAVRYETPREYISRQPSVRPEGPPENIRYEIPREYVSRQQSARPEGPTENVRYELREYVGRQGAPPEAPPREYAASGRPEAHPEAIPQREYSTRPIPVDQRGRETGYYGEPPRPAEVAYIERPRAREASVVVYADDVRREVYR